MHSLEENRFKLSHQDRGFSYITVVSTDDYLLGALALATTLKLTGAKYPLVTIINQNISQETIHSLHSYGISTIRINKIKYPENTIKYSQHTHWSHSFDKLALFSLTRYKKLVYIDSDVLVLRNIDELFDSPHLSAVIAGRSYPGNTAWSGLNSGIMVISPNEKETELLEESMSNVSKDYGEIGDQDIIQSFYDWPTSKDQILNECYNVFSNYVDYYIKNSGSIFGTKKIHCIHFTGAQKPWMRSTLAQAKWILQRARLLRVRECIYTIYYWIIITTAKLKLKRISIKFRTTK